MCLPAVAAILLPTTFDPVKLILRTAGWAMISSTTLGASAGVMWMILSAPAGRPASVKIWPSASWVRGRDLGGFDNHGVAGHERVADRAHGENGGRIPLRWEKGLVSGRQ